jgi:NADH-quinone oxidoreductase subunit A
MIAGYLALFFLVGFLFLLVNLLLGWFVRPHVPFAEKQEIYECGEPSIGSSFVQFDLRFYVVALLFIIFDVEVAFFFPWAVVYGKVTNLADDRATVVEVQTASAGAGGPGVATVALTPAARGIQRELGLSDRAASAYVTGEPATAAVAERQAAAAAAAIKDDARALARLSLVDIGVFFAVLLVGFAYVWARGDLDWVRAVSRQRAERPAASSDEIPRHEQTAISA